jgi:CDP-paratose 2-epimerase
MTDGLEGVPRTQKSSPRSSTPSDLSAVARFHRRNKNPVVITGGAGFIGTNLADHLLSGGVPVLIYDNLSRKGSELNLDWLARKHGAMLRIESGDVRDARRLASSIRESSAVFHFAAQVAVTDSISDPQSDFEVNAGGTLNVLEAIRALRTRPPLLFTSTNKVYGGLRGLKLLRTNDGYQPTSSSYHDGVDETMPLDFSSPYGCSKGAADQYVLDYARTFTLPAAVFRMSCIYGPHQHGTEDQGWIAHFLLRAQVGDPISIYGDGWQVRDVLYVEDLVDAFVRALNAIRDIAGEAFNIGGGPANAIHLMGLLDQIHKLQGHPCGVTFGEWRRGDQRFYVSNTEKFSKATGWSPRVSAREGVELLHDWFEQNRDALGAKLPIRMRLEFQEPPPPKFIPHHIPKTN